MVDKMLMTFLLHHRNNRTQVNNKRWPAGGQFIKSKKNDLHNFFCCVFGNMEWRTSNNPKCYEERVVTMHHFVYFTWKAIYNLHSGSQALPPGHRTTACSPLTFAKSKPGIEFQLFPSDWVLSMLGKSQKHSPIAMRMGDEGKMLST